MFNPSTTKTSWFHLAILLLVTLAAVLAIRQALAKPFVQWQEQNEVRVTEVKDLLAE